ncbi:uncharacterized protein LOC143207392 [Lasioglossum baleicum]|uniref:uncharacterized protein LOC143207392 n=1 Tax=Lasioglossum baleicum TaxID=434251 RepID=UPI003FCD3311
MLSVVESGKLVLTFQSIPPFVVESIFALTLAVLLAAPLILQVQHFLHSSPRCLTAHRKKHGTVRSHPVVMHYPASVFADSASSSNSDLHLESVRRTISTPLLQASGDIRNRGNPIIPNALADNTPKTTSEANGKDILCKNSSSFVATNSQLPIFGIPSCDYDVYRHKLIEAALRRQYDDYQPPGDVVLNSIHLNNNDSTVAVRLDDRYHHSIFDFVEEHYDATKGVSKKEAGHLHPLDHFLVKGPRKTETAEKETETGNVDASREPVSQEWTSSKVASNDVAGTKRRQREGSLDYVTKRGSRSSNAKPSGSAIPSSAKNSMYPRFADRRGVTRLPRATSSTDSISMKRDTFSESPRQDNRQDTFSSVDGVERESINCTTISSIDSESVRSESSKHPDDHSGHSRDSSIASTRTMSDRQTQPWLTGNHRAPFNRRDVNKLSPRKDKTTLKQPRHLIRNQSSSHTEPNRYTQPRSSSLANRNAQKQSSLTGTIKESKDVLRKLEPIRSETEEAHTNATSSTIDAKNPTESVASAQKPQSIGFFVDTVREPSETRFRSARPNGARIEHGGADNLGRPKSSPGPNQKYVKRCHDKNQRSKTIGPVSNPKAGLSSVSLLAKEQLNGNAAAVNSSGNDQEKKEWTNESGKTFEEADRNFQGDQPRANARLKSNLCQGRYTLDLIRRNDDRNENAGKPLDDLNRKKVGPGTRQLGGTTVRNHLPVSKRLTTKSRAPRQDGDSRNGARVQDSVRSMPIGSTKSPSIERKALKTVHSEDNDGNRSSKNQNENLKLPSRDTNAGIAMQVGLKKYIKKLKRVLSDRDNPDIDELVSLSLTDAILPEIEATLSSIEVQQVQTVLSMAEKKSEMMQKELPVVMGSAT